MCSRQHSDSACGRGDDGDALQQLGFRQHAEADRGDLSGEGLGQENGGYLGDLQGGRNAVVRARIGETRHRAAIDADGHHLDAMARLEGFQRRCEGVAVRAVGAVEEEQHMILAQFQWNGSDPPTAVCSNTSSALALTGRPCSVGSSSGVAQATRCATSAK
jgi:hypothetical protein